MNGQWAKRHAASVAGKKSECSGHSWTTLILVLERVFQGQIGFGPQGAVRIENAETLRSWLAKPDNVQHMQRWLGGVAEVSIFDAMKGEVAHGQKYLDVDDESQLAAIVLGEAPYDSLAMATTVASLLCKFCRFACSDLAAGQALEEGHTVTRSNLHKLARSFVEAERTAETKKAVKYRGFKFTVEEKVIIVKWVDGQPPTDSAREIKEQGEINLRDLGKKLPRHRYSSLKRKLRRVDGQWPHWLAEYLDQVRLVARLPLTGSRKAPAADTNPLTSPRPRKKRRVIHQTPPTS